MIKTLKWIILLIVTGGLLYYFGFWVMYYFSMKDVNERTRQIHCEEQRQEEFDGEILKIERYEYSPFMNEKFFGLKIQTTDASLKTVSYQFEINNNEELLEILKVGQKIQKEKGKDSFDLLTDSNEIKEIKVPDCN